MADCVREMTFEEEASFYEAEARAEFDKESGNGDCSKVNSILRRGMRIIRKAREKIEELNENLSEREKVVIQLRKQWQDAEMHICTMCAHFDHKTDGNIVFGNQTCGEICGYPFCKEKFTMWIPVSERVPELKEVFDQEGDDWRESIFVLVCTSDHNVCIGQRWKINERQGWAGLLGECFDVTHWMPLPEPPKEV